MSINEIYSWLLETDPVNDNSEIRMVWSNMASYCYFINIIDFDGMYKDKLKEVLKKSCEYDISVPDKNHDKVINLAKCMKSQKFADVKDMIHEQRTYQ